MPLLASSDASFDAGRAIGQSVGSLFWIVVLVCIAARRARQMNAPGANRTGYVAGLLLYAGWCGSLLYNIVETSKFAPAPAALLVALAAVLCILGGLSSRR